MLRRPTSLRALLLLLLLGAVTGVWLVALAVAWLQAHHELDELFDSRLEQTAFVLLDLDLEDLAVPRTHASDEDGHATRLPDHIEYQIWRHDGVLLLRSSGAPALAFSTATGFHAVEAGGTRWQSYARWNEDGDLLVRALDAEGERRAITSEIIGKIALPLAFALPLLAVLVWVAVSRGLRPLTRLSRDVAARDARHLEPLTAESVPDEARPLVQALNDLLDRLGRSLAAEKRFTADAAHELRTPLAAIRAQAQVARASTDETQQRRALDSIIDGSDRATRLAVQLLTLARAERDVPLEGAAVDLAEVARACVAQRAEAALRRNQQLGFRHEGHTLVTGDADLLQSLCGNLIDNAIAYAGEGSRIEVEVIGGGHDARLRVLDDGPGVDRALRDRLTDRFFRAPGQADRAGSGLGLAIAAQIARRHGASLILGEGLDGRGLGAQVVFPLLRS